MLVVTCIFQLVCKFSGQLGHHPAVSCIERNLIVLYWPFPINFDTKRYNIRSGACALLHPIECPCVGSSSAAKRAVVEAVRPLSCTFHCYRFFNRFCTGKHRVPTKSQRHCQLFQQQQYPRSRCCCTTLLRGYPNHRQKVSASFPYRPLRLSLLCSLLSAADCFHPSAEAHAVAAIALWNNMISPASKKDKSWNLSTCERSKKEVGCNSY